MTENRAKDAVTGPCSVRTVIHIGLPKTATTTLQETFATAEGIAYLGRRLGGARDGAFRQWFDGLLFGDAAPCADGSDSGATTPEAAGRDDAPRMISDERITLGHLAKSARHWSVEDAIPPERTASRLAHWFHDARILLVLRSQPELIESHFYQMRRVGVVRTNFATWLQASLSADGAFALDPMLDYARLVDAYAGAFGGDRVSVVFFEDIRHDLRALIGQVWHLLGTAPDAAASEVPHLNRRGGVHPALRRLAGAVMPLDRVKARAPGLVRAATRILPTDSARVTMISAQRTAIAARYGPANRRLAERLGRPLPEGYPLG